MKYSLRLEIKYNKFPQIAKALPQAADDIQARTVFMLVQAADPITPVDTGNLKNNKTIDPGGGGKAGSVHWHAPYAGFVNYGTRRMPARPFIDQAVAQVWPLYVEAMKAMCAHGGL